MQDLSHNALQTNFLNALNYEFNVQLENMSEKD